jgi:hypothetical protein
MGIYLINVRIEYEKSLNEQETEKIEEMKQYFIDSINEYLENINKKEKE